MKVKSFPLRLSEDFHRELKIYCVEKGISMQDFIIKAVEEKANQRVFTPERTAV